MTSLKTSIKTITYLSDIGCLEIQGASLRANNGVLSPVMEKRMINLLIIVLRAVVAVANALIAVLELIRELID